MNKTMTIKQLLGMYSPIEILKAINKHYGLTNYTDAFAIYDTYDLLFNEDNNPIHRDRASKYHLELMIASEPEVRKAIHDMAKGKERCLDHRMAGYLYYSLVNNEKHYKISKRYVKNCSDFSMCRIEMPDYISKLECACLVVLSFTVLNESLIKCYGELSSLEYIRKLKMQKGDNA